MEKQYQQQPMEQQYTQQQYQQQPVVPQLKVIQPDKMASYVGYVVGDVELRSTQNGNEVCDVRLGLETGIKDQQGKSLNEFISLTCWGSAAVYYSRLIKGDWIEIKGVAHNEPFINNQGVQMDKWKVSGVIAPLPSHLALRIEKSFARPQQTQPIQPVQQQYAQPVQQPTQSAQQPQGFVDVTTEELPF